MSIILLALITIYVVDVSGFTDSWRSGLARWLGKSESQLRDLKPFDCGKCMTFWTTLIYAVATHRFSIPTMALCAGLSLLSVPIGNAMNLIRETMNALIRRINKWIEKI